VKQRKRNSFHAKFEKLHCKISRLLWELLHAVGRPGCGGGFLKPSVQTIGTVCNACGQAKSLLITGKFTFIEVVVQVSDRNQGFCNERKLAKRTAKVRFSKSKKRFFHNKFALVINACWQNLFCDMCVTPANIVEDHLNTPGWPSHS
jgi:hypothetical protein